ncbi:MAG: relaxase/mobilization nuclease domain-containing protein [Ruminococcus flavefaciens]
MQNIFFPEVSPRNLISRTSFFAEIRKHDTGKSYVYAQQFIVSFKPGEITPERALQLGQEICEQFLKGKYQYFMVLPIDKDHTLLWQQTFFITYIFFISSRSSYISYAKNHRISAEAA